MIDWAATGQMLAGIGAIAGSVSIVIVAVLGRNAVANFRRQKLVEREIEHAERALAVSYQLKHAASAIRSPLTTSQEIAASKEELEKQRWFSEEQDAKKKDRLIQSNVFYQRFRQFSDVYDTALAAVPFVRAYFGEESADSLQELVRVRHTVRVYADAYARDGEQNLDLSNKINDFIWEGSVEDDPILFKITASMTTLERSLLPVIRKNAQGGK